MNGSKYRVTGGWADCYPPVIVKITEWDTDYECGKALIETGEAAGHTLMVAKWPDGLHLLNGPVDYKLESWEG